MADRITASNSICWQSSTTRVTSLKSVYPASLKVLKFKDVPLHFYMLLSEGSLLKQGKIRTKHVELGTKQVHPETKKVQPGTKHGQSETVRDKTWTGA